MKNKKNRLIINMFNDFIDSYKAEVTKRDYSFAIKEFISFITGKDITEIKISDMMLFLNNKGVLVDLNKIHIERFKNKLLKNNANTSTIKKICAIRSFYKYLYDIGYDINYELFKVSKMKREKKGYDILTPEQIIEMSELAKNEKYDGDLLSVLILLAANTGIRISVLLKLSWNHIGTKNDRYFIHDNGESYVYMESWLYDKLLLIKQEESPYVFSKLKVDKINDAVRRLVKKMGLENQWIVPHSINKSIAAYRMSSNDPNKIKEVNSIFNCKFDPLFKERVVNPDSEYIYFIKDTKNNTIKIGITGNIKNRMSALQTSSPYKLELIKLIDGDINKEKELHLRFDKYRLSGEWFESSRELLEYIDSL